MAKPADGCAVFLFQRLLAEHPIATRKKPDAFRLSKSRRRRVQKKSLNRNHPTVPIEGCCRILTSLDSALPSPFDGEWRPAELAGAQFALAR